MKTKNTGYKKPKTKAYKNTYSTKKVDTKQDKALKTLTKKVAKLETAPEIKYIWDYDVGEVGASAGLSYFGLPIGQGDDYNQRIGEVITLKKQEININVIMGAATGALRYRVVYFLDRQVDGNPPALLTSTSLAAGLLDDSLITDTQFSPINPRCSERYFIYSDKSYVFNRIEPTLTERHTIKLNKTFNTKIKFATSGATIAAVPSKMPYVAIFAASVTAIGSYDVIWKSYYTDS